MINKKISIIAMILVVAAGSTIYGIIELAPPAITIGGGHAQFADRTFAERIDVSGIVVEGKITDLGVKLFTEESTEMIDGKEVVFDTRIVPKTEITIEISETFKDNYGLDSKYVTVYDRSHGGIGSVNGKKALYTSPYTIDYKIGDKGFFLIENDRGLWLMGYASFYSIEDGKNTIKTQLDKEMGKNPLELKDVRDILLKHKQAVQWFSWN